MGLNFSLDIMRGRQIYVKAITGCISGINFFIQQISYGNINSKLKPSLAGLIARSVFG